MIHASSPGQARSWCPARGLKATAHLCAAAVLASLVVVSTPPPAQAATEKVLILANTVTGGSSSIEANEAAAKGFAVDLVDDATWSAMTTTNFASYRAIILGDPTCAGVDAVQAAAANTAVWGPAVTGDVAIIGTDPVFHASQGGERSPAVRSTSPWARQARRGPTSRSAVTTTAWPPAPRRRSSTP